MLDNKASTTPATALDRESRVQELIDRLRPNAEQTLRAMAEQLVDLPEEKSFGQIEYTLRDLAHDLVAEVHQAGLDAGKKRGTPVPAASVRIAKPMPASSATASKAG